MFFTMCDATPEEFRYWMALEMASPSTVRRAIRAACRERRVGV